MAAEDLQHLELGVREPVAAGVAVELASGGAGQPLESVRRAPRELRSGAAAVERHRRFVFRIVQYQ